MAFDRNAEADQAYGHKPVLLDECLEALAIRPDGVYLDGTLGRAGHSLEILRRLTAGGRLIGLDRDGTALEAARVRLAEYADRVSAGPQQLQPSGGGAGRPAHRRRGRDAL